MEAGPTTYTIAPKSNVVFNENGRSRTTNVDILKQIKGRSGGGGGRR
jgi:transcription factor SPN1